MIIKQIVSVTLAFSLATSLYGAESKPKKQTKTSAKSSKEQVKNVIPKIGNNEFEVSQTSEMPPVSPLVRNHKTETVYDPSTKLMWQDKSESKSNRRKWNDAITYCNNLTFGGYSDWRLPEIKELLSITDMTRSSLSIKNGFKNVEASHYWSSSTDARLSGMAWYVYFSKGDDSTDAKFYDNWVRCVRDSKL